jgi:hypothetical protein
LENNWYVVEHQIRERLTEARKAARIRALTHDRTSTPRRMSSVRTAIIRLAKWALGSRNALPSGALTHAGQRPTGDELLRVGARERTPPCAKRLPECRSDPAVDVRQTSHREGCGVQPLTFHLEERACDTN